MSLRIEHVTGESGARAWQAVDAAVVPVDHPGLVADPVEGVLAELPAGTPSEWVGYYVGYEAGGAAVAHGRLQLPQRDNVHLAHLNCAVVPAQRRRGYGTAMFDALLDVARGEGRRTFVLESAGPLDAPAAGDEFLRARGAVPALNSIRRVLELARVDPSQHAELGREAVARAGDYRVVQWVDRVPEELVADAAVLLGRMATDAPMGALEWGKETWDGSRYRERERVNERSGRRVLAAGAVHEASGRMVAYTDLALYPAQPAVVEQWDTIVAPQHRGHRLGMLVKLANLRLLGETFTGVERVSTWNADSNAYMVPINEALGFRPVERGNEWQLSLADARPG